MTDHRVLYLICEGFFYFFSGLAKFLPHRIFRIVFTSMFKLPIRFLAPRKRIIKNLDSAFGETYSTATKKGLAKGVQDHFVKNLTDCFLQLDCSNRTRELVKLKGKENLETALAKGNGVIALGAHFGNFVLLGSRLGLDGYTFHSLFRLPQDPRIRSMCESVAKSFHQRLIPSWPRRRAVTKILDVLAKNEIVFILADNLKRGKVQSRLFGRTVRASRGPVSLAIRSGASILPTYLVRDYGGELQLVIEPEIDLKRNGSLPGDIEENTHQINHHLETLIRRYPDQWNWLTVRMNS